MKLQVVLNPARDPSKLQARCVTVQVPGSETKKFVEPPQGSTITVDADQGASVLITVVNVALDGRESAPASHRYHVPTEPVETPDPPDIGVLTPAPVPTDAAPAVQADPAPAVPVEPPAPATDPSSGAPAASPA